MTRISCPFSAAAFRPQKGFAFQEVSSCALLDQPWANLTLFGSDWPKLGAVALLTFYFIFAELVNAFVKWP